MTYKEIRKALNESLFNPKVPVGTIKLIMEHKDPTFYESRAIELIREAQCLSSPSFGNDLVKQQYLDKMTKAVSLLALAKTIRSKS